MEYLIPTLDSSKFKNIVSNEEIIDKPLDKIIGFHIISDDEKTLIPIDLIENLNVDQEDISIQFSALNNPYDYEKKITNSESNRLQNHSTEIKDYLDKLESYKILLTSDELSLYSQLNKLRISFIKGGKHGVEGGSENLSGTNAQLALTNFLEYWDKLSAKSKDEALKIPEFKLFMGKLPKTQNDAQSYCVEADGADKIAPILQSNTSKLTAITTSESNKSKMVEQRKNECASAHKQIINSIDTHSYKGNEPLGISLGLMLKYNVNLNINDIKTLIDFVKKLDINRLDEYLKEDDIKSQIKTVISSSENIFGLADLAADKFKKLIDILDICKFCNPQERLSLLAIMPTKEHKSIILEKSKLDNACINYPKNIKYVIQALQDEPELKKQILSDFIRVKDSNLASKTRFPASLDEAFIEDKSSSKNLKKNLNYIKAQLNASFKTDAVKKFILEKATDQRASHRFKVHGLGGGSAITINGDDYTVPRGIKNIWNILQDKKLQNNPTEQLKQIKAQADDRKEFRGATAITFLFCSYRDYATKQNYADIGNMCK